MQRLLKAAFVAYVLLLSALLFTGNPAKLIGCGGGLPNILRTLMPMAHLTSFLVLAVLALLPRWPVPRWSIVLMLAAYGGMTEIVQGFTPMRTPDWADWFQDLGGLALGVAFCWAVMLLVTKTSFVRRIRTFAHVGHEV
jgi:VanZ family protein